MHSHTISQNNGNKPSALAACYKQSDLAGTIAVVVLMMVGWGVV